MEITIDNLSLAEMPHALHLDASELQDYLAEVVEIKKQSPVTIASIVSAIGYEQATIVCNGIIEVAKNDPIVSAALTALATVGIDLSQPDRQEMIIAIGLMNSWPAELTVSIQRLGVDRKPRHKILGIDILPTMDECDAWLKVRKFEYKKSIAIQMFSLAMQIDNDPAQVMQQCWDNA